MFLKFLNASVGMRLVRLIAPDNLLLIVSGAAAPASVHRSNAAMRPRYENQLAPGIHLADACSNQMLVGVILNQAAFGPDSPDAARRVAGKSGGIDQVSIAASQTIR